MENLDLVLMTAGVGTLYTAFAYGFIKAVWTEKGTTFKKKEP
jgi:hypothetical protein